MQEVLSIGRSNPRLLRARLDIFTLSYLLRPWHFNLMNIMVTHGCLGDPFSRDDHCAG
jgi:hypothetical protein